MAKPNIILTGFMATGKTTVGKRVARDLGYDFVDTDEMIAREAGMSVKQIFQTQGEPVFRRMESDLAKELAKREGLVISTGGGMLTDEGNAKVLGQTGRIFCLTATAEEIYNRVAEDTRAKRPLLESPDPMKAVRRLLAQREAAYKKFIQVSTSAKTPDEVASDLVGMIRANTQTKGSQE